MNIPLLLAALIPAIVLCVYLFCMDRVEKEPLGLLLKLLLFGVASCFPAILGEQFLSPIIESSFSGTTQKFVDAFVGVALVEEICKWAFLVIGTKNDRNFNHLFDGVIYATFVSLGFAALENIGYVIQNGFYVAVTRAILSVPGHMFFGVMMGYYYSLWHITDQAKEIESDHMALGIIPSGKSLFNSSKYKRLSIIVPILFHGFYDYCLFVAKPLTLVAFVVFVVFMYVYCFGKIKKMSANDAATIGYAKALLIQKYPSLKNDIV